MNIVCFVLSNKLVFHYLLCDPKYLYTLAMLAYLVERGEWHCSYLVVSRIANIYWWVIGYYIIDG